MCILILSALNQSESDDESLRRIAVSQASLHTFEHVPYTAAAVNLLVFDATTQMETKDPKQEKKVRISIKIPSQSQKKFS